MEFNFTYMVHIRPERLAAYLQPETQKHCKPTNLVWRKVLAKIEEGLVVKNGTLSCWHSSYKCRK